MLRSHTPRTTHEQLRSTHKALMYRTYVCTVYSACLCAVIHVRTYTYTYVTHTHVCRGSTEESKFVAKIALASLRMYSSHVHMQEFHQNSHLLQNLADGYIMYGHNNYCVRTCKFTKAFNFSSVQADHL